MIFFVVKYRKRHPELVSGSHQIKFQIFLAVVPVGAGEE
jgi:hypothetical protein